MADVVAEPTTSTPTTPRRRLKLRYLVAALICVGAVVWLVVGGLATNIVYLRPVSDAVAHREDLGAKRFRMGGTVVPGTIEETRDGVRFRVAEGDAVATVDHQGDPPDLFKNCAPVVVEGHWQGEVFSSDRLLIKHGEEYRPPSGVAGDDCPAHPGSVGKDGG